MLSPRNWGNNDKPRRLESEDGMMMAGNGGGGYQGGSSNFAARTPELGFSGLGMDDSGGKRGEAQIQGANCEMGELAPYPSLGPSSTNPLDDPVSLCTINSPAGSPSHIESNVTKLIEPNATSPIPQMSPDPSTTFSSSLSGSTAPESGPNAELGSAVSQGELASHTGSSCMHISVIMFDPFSL
ncbi:hypothetical protein Cgig2_025792 [Carnegiea gigantea]|uniref:Uncharacterized protein n=1 Tax=Carnegiea gigantea TaxID=171969 RepID=A0A9Q1GMH4_9CARY|nr:hypothetical protein Cgig2_000380 [Carnegiea gigantea]KAJ8422283.1 hypothetical protein Cgig2_025792 [Carnegiea gigantea]